MEEDYQDYAIQFKAQSQTLMVWGIISYNGVGPLVRVDQLEEGETSLNGERYLTLKKILTQKLSWLKRWETNFPTGQFQERNIDVLDWPPQSPDMSLIEIIWNEMKFSLRGRVFNNKDELWSALKKEWKAITLNYIRKLYDNIPRRILSLKEANKQNIDSL